MEHLTGLAPARTPEMAVVCPRCAAGAAGRRERLSMSAIAGLLSQHARLERGLLHTLAELLLHPGRMIRAYFDGYRAAYVNPVTYMLVAAAASLLCFELYEQDYMAWTRADMQARLGSGEFGADSPFFAAYLDGLLSATKRTATTSFLVCVPLALMTRLLFGDRRINLAECFAFSFYVQGTALFLGTGAALAVWISGEWSLMLGGTLVYMGYTLWAGMQLFGRSLATFGRLLLVSLVSGGIAMGVVLAGAVAYAVLRTTGYLPG